MRRAKVQFDDRNGWREWLERNHDAATEIWLVYYKKHTGLPSVTQPAAVEEALCFGWIDGKVRRIDEQRYMQRYTPRRPNSIWSKKNKRRVERLIATGRMTPAGLALVAAAKASGEWQKATATHNAEMHPKLARRLARSKRLTALWEALSPSHRKHFLWWINDAKRAATQQRRIDKTLEMLKEGRRPGIG